MKAKIVKKKNPQDATLRNINALKKRVSTLEKEMTMVIKELVKARIGTLDNK